MRVIKTNKYKLRYVQALSLSVDLCSFLYSNSFNCTPYFVCDHTHIHACIHTHTSAAASSCTPFFLRNLSINLFFLPQSGKMTILRSSKLPLTRGSPQYPGFMHLVKLYVTFLSLPAHSQCVIPGAVCNVYRCVDVCCRCVHAVAIAVTAILTSHLQKSSYHRLRRAHCRCRCRCVTSIPASAALLAAATLRIPPSMTATLLLLFCPDSESSKRLSLNVLTYPIIQYKDHLVSVIFDY